METEQDLKIAFAETLQSKDEQISKLEELVGTVLIDRDIVRREKLLLEESILAKERQMASVVADLNNDI